MRKLFLVLFLTVTQLQVWAANGTGVASSQEQSLYAPGKIVVKFKSGSSEFNYDPAKSVRNNAEFALINAKLKNWDVQQADKTFANAKRPFDTSKTDLSCVYELSFAADVDVTAIAADIAACENVEYAEPVYLYKKFEIPYDPNFGNQNYLQTVMLDKAWDVGKGSRDIVIAIIDDGVDWYHEDLFESIWNNLGEDINGDGKITEADINNIDDDNNGYIDDFIGWDFMHIPDDWSDFWQPLDGSDGKDPDNDPWGMGGHGTHVAGIAGATSGNGIGIAGASWGCSIMPLKCGWVARGTMEGYIYEGYKAIYYAVDNGANIINMSWGGEGYSKLNQDLVNYAWEHGVLCIASAGNDASEIPIYPPGYDHVFSIAGTGNDNDQVYSFTNYGDWIDLSAPGSSIYSTLNGNRYGYKSGTSMAAPLVAGIAGLLWSQHPDWSIEQITDQLIATADPIDDVNPDYRGMLGAGRINAFRALTEEPSMIKVESFTLDDSKGNSNGVFDSGETIELFVTLKSSYKDVENVLVSITTQDVYVSIDVSDINFGNLATNASVSNLMAPFVLTASQDTPEDHPVLLEVQISGNDGEYVRTESQKITINPLYKTHNINNINFSISGFGIYGYYDRTNTKTQQGEGFQYPKGSMNALQAGSFWAGTSSENVADCSSTGSYYDWITVDGGELEFNETNFSDQDGNALFDDSENGFSMGLTVLQQSFAWNNPVDEDYIILEYTLVNTSDEELSDLYAGLYMDWDIINEAGNLNSVNYDFESDLGYMTADGANYYGTCVLYPETAGFRAIDLGQGEYSVIQDEQKYQYLSQGFSIISSNEAHDWANVISAGPFTLAPGKVKKVAFAVLGGNDLSDIKANVAAARQKHFSGWLNDITIDFSPLPDTENIDNPYPVQVDLSSVTENITAAELYWRIAGETQFETLPMDLKSGKTWYAEIPAQNDKEIEYFFSIKNDNDQSAFSPVTAPALSYHFYAGADTIRPVINDITQLENTLIKGPFIIESSISDNFGVDTTNVQLIYYLNEEGPFNKKMNKGANEIFSAELTFDRALVTGDRISYYISAFDISTAANNALSDIITFDIVDFLLVDDFEDDRDIWDYDNGYVWDYSYTAYEGYYSYAYMYAYALMSNYTEDAALTVGYDFSQNMDIALQYYVKYGLEEGDSCLLQVTRDGIDWQTFKAYTGQGGDEWIKESFSMTEYTGPGNDNVRFRFRLLLDDDTVADDGIYIDYIGFKENSTSGIDDVEADHIPTVFRLEQNYPNPFNPETVISFDLPQSEYTELTIYNVMGHKVATLLNASMNAGSHQFVWNGKDANGNQAASGVYFYQLKSGTFNKINKMILLR